MNHSTPGLPVHHQLPEFTQTHDHRVSDGREFEQILGDSEGQGILACCSPRGRKESDTTKRLYFQTTFWVWIRTKLVGQLWGIIHYTGQVLAGSYNFTILQRSLQVLAFLKFSLSIDFYHLFHMMENHLEGPPSRGLRAGLVLIVCNLIGSFILEILVMKPMEREGKRISKSLKT